MKAQLSFLVVSSLACLGNASAQEPSRSFTLGRIEPLDLSQKEPEATEGVHLSWLKLYPVTDKPGFYRLDVLKVEPKLVLQTLTDKVGGKALLDNQYSGGIIGRFSSIGTPEQLIHEIAVAMGATVGRVGIDWVFVPKPEAQSLLPIVIAIPQSHQINPLRPDPDFNMNRNPGHIAPGARPYEFNGKRYYGLQLIPNFK